MRFGPLDTALAEGAILAHSLTFGGRTIRKGTRLTREDAAALAAAGHRQIIAAQLETGDVHEDVAAERVARALLADGGNVRLAAAFTGRVNLHAATPGLLVVDRAAIDAANAIDEAITVATLPAFARVAPQTMVATVKIIPFAASRLSLDAVCAAVAGALRVATYRALRVGLVASELAALKASVMDKTARMLGDRLAVHGGGIVREIRCAHDADAIAAAIADLDADDCDLTVVFGASAIVDRRDVVPAGIERAGGQVAHFGMPVDPGNLLLLASRRGKPVLGAPGCARSPRENGFDWVLDRIAAGIEVTAGDIAGLGVGGLLMEIPSRPQPRSGRQAAPAVGEVAAVVLAAGRSSRMGGPHKLLEHVGGKALVRRSVEAVLASRARPVVVVTGHRGDEVAAALDGLDVRIVVNPDYADGLSTSLHAGLSDLPEGVAGAIVCLADMPGVDAGLLDKLVDAFRAAPEGAIVVPTVNGKRGNPVVWARRYFAALASVSGDVGGRALIGENAARVIEVALDDDAALDDIDTPEALDAARRSYGE
ncbi:MAG: NTP transferase domain-containing protein [Rhodobiaceae bacterium]|nr:NTP transferase domain-containing protein [Rhodobiaceae bacterium]